MSSDKRFYRSGELAQLAGVSSDTLRHYERKRVLPRPFRQTNDYRQYPESALQRVQLIRRALAVGFTLDELSAVLSVRDAGGAPCGEVRTLAAAKLADVELRLREITDLRNELRSILKEWDNRLETRAPGERVHLLESLGADHDNKLGNRHRASQINLKRRKSNRKS